MYRILRDNKERGPFSLEDLLALQLKPFDLIWVEGKSAGWRYPSEIVSLKPYLDTPVVSSLADPEVAVTPISQTHPASQNSRSSSTQSNNYAVPVAFNGDLENEEDELTADKLEKKANEIYQRIQAYNEQQEKNQQGAQTKYARSLDDLKQEYADWMHNKMDKKKSRKVSISKPGLIGAGITCLMILIASFYYAGKDEKKMEAGLKPGQHFISNSATQPVELPKKNEVVPVLDILPGPPSPVTKAVEAPKFILPRELSVDEFIDSVRKALARGSSGRTNKNSKTAEKNTGETTVLNNDPILTEPAPQAEKKETSGKQQVNMNARYQQDANKKSITSLEVSIQNNSADLLKTVTVDIFYYKKGDRLFDKETLYFNNIQPGITMTLSRPGNKKAATARFQLGQVNSFQN